MTLSQFLKPERQLHESYEKYRVRRCAGNLYIKEDTTKLIWNSRILKTYRKKDNNNGN